MSERFDVIVVGARCAGSPLATLLARRGVRVAVLERATFPHDTLSSHLFETDALTFLDRLGVAEQLRATGAPFVRRMDMRIEDVQLTMDMPLLPGDVGGMASIRRWRLDPILAEAATAAGAQVRMGVKVTELLEDGGRVAGVRAIADGAETQLRARLVVGADGRHSTIARLCRSRRYNVTPSQRILYWAFFEGAKPATEPTFLSHRWGERFILGIPSDEGLYQVLIWPEMAELEAFQADLDGAFMAHARTCEPIADALAGAHRVGKTIGATRFEGFFRDPSGPGWVLSGDAGHFKSPAPGRGIGDAFLQAEALAPAIVGGLEGSEEQLDRAMKSWGRWRDKEFAEHYWLANEFEKPGTVPEVLTEVVRKLHEKGQAGQFFDVLNHRIKPSQLLTPARLLGAVGRLMAKGGVNRRALLGETASLAGEDLNHRWLNRRPAYAGAD
jgi:flavin-dependent dehydrogenase